MRPLYNSLARAKLDLGAGHAGLWYDKFCDRWNAQWTLGASGTSGSKKLEWIETVTTGSVGKKDMLDEAVLRVARLVLAKRGSFDVFTSESRFVTGLGRSHPVIRERCRGDRLTFALAQRAKARARDAGGKSEAQGAGKACRCRGRAGRYPEMTRAPKRGP